MSTQDIAREAARQISNHWRSGSFRKDGGVVEGITPIIQDAIKAEMENARNWAIEAHNSAKNEQQLREQLKDAQDEAFGAYAEGDALREQLSAERLLSKWLPKGTDKLLEALQAASDFMDYLRANTGVSDEWPIEFKVAPDAVDQVNKLLNDFESKVYAITKPK